MKTEINLLQEADICLIKLQCKCIVGYIVLFKDFRFREQEIAEMVTLIDWLSEVKEGEISNERCEFILEEGGGEGNVNFD